jgi:hypothetical protein
MRRSSAGTKRATRFREKASFRACVSFGGLVANELFDRQETSSSTPSCLHLYSSQETVIDADVKFFVVSVLFQRMLFNVGKRRRLK